MSAAADCGLIVFLRLPEKGKVKTRIASSLGQDAALVIYKEMTDITLQMVSNLAMQVYLFYEGGLPDLSNRKPSFQYLSQPPGNLGEKMHHAFEITLQKHKKAIIIGSDCPALTVADVNEGNSKLDTTDIVIGPSADGGYYLLGCKEVIPPLFKNIHWSSSSVLDDTIDIIKSQHRNYYLLRTLNDIDVEADWVSFKKSQPGG